MPFPKVIRWPDKVSLQSIPLTLRGFRVVSKKRASIKICDGEVSSFARTVRIWESSFSVERMISCPVRPSAMILLRAETVGCSMTTILEGLLYLSGNTVTMSGSKAAGSLAVILEMCVFSFVTNCKLLLSRRAVNAWSAVTFSHLIVTFFGAGILPSGPGVPAVIRSSMITFTLAIRAKLLIAVGSGVSTMVTWGRISPPSALVAGSAALFSWARPARLKVRMPSARSSLVFIC